MGLITKCCIHIIGSGHGEQHLNHLAAWGVTGISLVHSCSHFGKSSGPHVRVLSPLLCTYYVLGTGTVPGMWNEWDKEWSTDTCHNMDEFPKKKKKKIMVSKRSQTQKTTYHMIPLIWRVQEKQIYRYRKQISGCLGLGLRMGSDGMREIRGMMETSLNWTRW